MIGSPLQSASAADQLAVLLLFLGLVVAVILSLLILLRGIRSYRATGDPALAGLAAGILLLSGVPILLNVGLLTFVGTDETVVQILTDLTRLCGLGLVLYVIYATQR